MSFALYPGLVPKPKGEAAAILSGVSTITAILWVGLNFSQHSLCGAELSCKQAAGAGVGMLPQQCVR